MFPKPLDTNSMAPTEIAIRESLGILLQDITAVGSRVTCSPPPVDTDEDWLVLVRSDPAEAMREAGYSQDGSPDFYTGNDRGGFRSWRKGDVNIVTTEEFQFYDLFVTATMLAKRFNLMNKGDRIALFQAVLYGVRWHNLEDRTYESVREYPLSDVEGFQA